MNARIEKYLKAYSLIQLTGWLVAILILPFSFVASYAVICAVQLLAVLEIFHAYKKWNHSSPLYCFVQVGARLFILGFTLWIITISLLKPIPYFEAIVYIMLTAWCIAEIIRYMYYLRQLFGHPNTLIIWLRYSAFIICYPVGLACEFFVMFNVLKYNDLVAVKIVMILVAIAYLFMFPRLYNHLLIQRKQKLSNPNL